MISLAGCYQSFKTSTSSSSPALLHTTHATLFQSPPLFVLQSPWIHDKPRMDILIQTIQGHLPSFIQIQKENDCIHLHTCWCVSVPKEWMTHSDVFLLLPLEASKSGILRMILLSFLACSRIIFNTWLSWRRSGMVFLSVA